MRRRDFLRAGSLGWVAAGLVLGGSRASARTLLGDAPALIGYRPRWTDPIVDAAALASGDRGLAPSGVRLSVFGLRPRDASWKGRAALDVLFPVEEDARRADGAHSHRQGHVFHAWIHEGGDPRGNARASSFVVPLDEIGRLRLSASWNEREHLIELTTGAESERPKLRSGSYLIARATSPAIVVTIEHAASEPRSQAPWRTDHV